MHTPSKTQLIGEIRHFLDEICRFGLTVNTLEGVARERLIREWHEVSETLDARMKMAKYFRHQKLVFIKYINIQTIEVVLTPTCMAFEPFNGGWMNTIADSDICSEQEYLEAVAGVLLEEGELCNE